MQRLTRMDGLRGLLAVYVMLGHALPFTCLPGWVEAPFRHGEAAVDLFFALSGLVIPYSLARFGGAFGPFMAARAKRLLPVYFPVLTAAILITLLGNPLPAMPWAQAQGHLFWSPGLPPHAPWHVLAHVLLVQGLIPQNILPYAYVTLLGPAWSLSTEWQFYVLIGLFARSRTGGLALALLGLAAAYHLFWPVGAWQFSRAFLPADAAFFALGLASAVALRGGGWAVFSMCLVGACALGGMGGMGKALVPIAWAVVMLVQRYPWGALLEHKTLQYLGAISYPLYLVNEPVQRTLALALAPIVHGDALLFTLLWLPLAITASLAVAAALHHGVERHFMRRDKKLLPKVIAAPVQG